MFNNVTMSLVVLKDKFIVLDPGFGPEVLSNVTDD